MDALKLSLCIIFHPLYTMDLIKRRHASLWKLPSLILFILAILSMVLNLTMENYAVSGRKLQDINLGYELLFLLLPVISWIFVSTMITGIMSGEARVTEIIAATAYSFVPYIIGNVVLTAVSWAVSDGSAVFYQMARGLMLIWVLLLIFISLLRLNNYSFGKSLLVTLIVVLSMVILWALLLLFFALTCQSVMTISELITEISMNNL